MVYTDVNVIVSDIVISYFIPIPVDIMAENHKVTCVYRTCILANSFNYILLLWRKFNQYNKKINEQNSNRLSGPQSYTDYVICKRKIMNSTVQ